MPSGIYQIENRTNGNSYVGSTVNLRKRWQAHLGALRRGQHKNQHLQRAFDKYGEPAFLFCVLEHTEPDKLIEREQHFLDTLLPGYNISPTAGSRLGHHPSLETRAKLSVALMGHPVSPETREKIGAGNRGKRHSAAMRKKMSEGRRHYHPSEETKRKTAQAMMGERNHFYGKAHSPETRAKISAALTGKHLSAETRAKLSEATRGERNPFYGRRHSAEARLKISEALRGRPWSPARREAQSKRMAEMPDYPE